MSAGGVCADMMTGSAPLARPLLRWAIMKTMMLLLGCASLVAVGIPDVARAATDDDCRQFHRECVDAQAAAVRCSWKAALVQALRAAPSSSAL